MRLAIFIRVISAAKIQKFKINYTVNFSVVFELYFKFWNCLFLNSRNSIFTINYILNINFGINLIT